MDPQQFDPAALIPVVSAWWGALGALALLLFVAGIGYNLVRAHTGLPLLREDEENSPHMSL